jgi:F0F1-type ATP synthase beta subunit
VPAALDSFLQPKLSQQFTNRYSTPLWPQQHRQRHERRSSITQVIGSTFDVEFEDKMPAIYNAVRVTSEHKGVKVNLTGEVQQHLGGGRVRCVALGSTDGLMRGQDCVDTGGPVTVPCGRSDAGPRVQRAGRSRSMVAAPCRERTLAHPPRSPAAPDLSTKTEIFETGIKVIDLLTPFVRGGKAGLFGGAGLGKTVILTELIARIASSTVVTRCSPAWANEPAKGPTSGSKCKKPRSATRAAALSTKRAWCSVR